MNKAHTILYIDDEPINLELFEINMQKHYNVLTAESGGEGLQTLEQEPEISVILCDEKMPGMTGLELIRNAKKKRPDIQYFILTGYDITPKIATALDEKLILKCLKKPFKIKEILSEIDSCLNG